MKHLFLLLISAVLLLSSEGCNRPRHKRTYYVQQPKGAMENLLFVSRDTAYAVHDLITPSVQEIRKTVDGGRSWHEVFGVEGDRAFFHKAADGKVYLFAERYTGKKKVSVHATSDGDVWTPVFRAADDVIQMFFCDSLTWCRLNGDHRTVYKTTDGGNSWNELFRTSEPMREEDWTDGMLSFFTTHPNDDFSVNPSRVLIRLDVSAGIYRADSLDTGVRGDIIEGDYFMAEKEGTLQFYRTDPHGAFELRHTFAFGTRLGTKFMFAHGDKIYAGIIDYDGSFLPSGYLYFSGDGGRKWKDLTDELPALWNGGSMAALNDEEGFHLWIYLYGYGIIRFTY